MSIHSVIVEGSEIIRQKAPDFVPKVGLILGSGLGGITDSMKNKVVIPYQDLPGFPVSAVMGHAGKLVLGTLGGVSVVCLSGRVHLYEGKSPDAIKIIIRMLKHLGCLTVILTNAAGSLRPEVTPGNVSLIYDHLNFMWTNPLIGPNDDEFGDRFPSLENAYDENLRIKMKAVARELDYPLTEGVYAAVMGPCFETAAEIRAYRTLGVDLVGMSTVPEVIVARHCGLKVLAISAITNMATGISKEPVAHDQVLIQADIAGKKLCRLIEIFLERNKHGLSE